jgi:glycerol-3-phosphate dehydrogenase
LYDDGASEAKAVTRDYVLELDQDGPPLLSVFGGKITTARHLAHEAIKRLATACDWSTLPVTSHSPLPGGDIPEGFEAYLNQVRTRWPFLGPERAERMARAYGTLLGMMLDGVDNEVSMGTDFGGGLTQVEVDWLVTHEWARTAEDVLTRRTKIGLATGAETAERLHLFLSSRQDAKTPREP